MKINVAYLEESNVFAGAENSLFWLVKMLDKNTFNPFLFFVYPQNHHKRYSSLGVFTCYLVNKPKWWMGSSYWEKPFRGTDFIKRGILGLKLALSLRKQGVKILHINLAKSNCFWWVFWPKLLGVKVVLHCRSDPIDWVPGKNVQRLSDKIISVSDFIKQKVIQKNSSSPVTTVYNPVLFGNTGYDASLKNALLNKLGFNEQTKLISSVGLLSPHKGHDTAIIVFSRLLVQFPSLTLYVAGGGSESELNRLKGIANSEGVGDKVYFSNGQIAHIEDVYRASDFVFSLTKRGEAFGRVPFESMSCGVPVIAPNLGGAAELIESGKTGFLVNTNDVEDVLSQAELIMSDLDAAFKVAEQGRLRFKELLSPERSAREVEKVYLDCFG